MIAPEVLSVEAVVVGLEELAELLHLDVPIILVDIKDVVNDKTVFLKEFFIETRW